MGSWIIHTVTAIFLSDWLSTLALVFFGCCSNAITLEQLTSEYPQSGTLITFFQFLIISLYGLPRRVTFSPPLTHHEQPDILWSKYQKLLDYVAQGIAAAKASKNMNDLSPLWVAIDGNGYASGKPVSPSSQTAFGEALAQRLRATPDFSSVIRYCTGDTSVPGSVALTATTEELQQSILSTWANPHSFPSFHTSRPRCVAGTKVSSEVDPPVAVDDSVILVDAPVSMLNDGDVHGRWWDVKIFLYMSSESGLNLQHHVSLRDAIIIDLSSTDAVIVRTGRSPSFYTYTASHNSTSLATRFLRSIPLPSLKPRKIPLAPYVVQVILFYLISLLNNAAFGYRIPMSVHIIFRSGGLLVSMLLGWFVGKRYTLSQALSVFLVTLGVVLATLSASQPKSTTTTSTYDDGSLTSTNSYAMGIAILSLALILSGFLGLVQDWTYKQYTGPRPEVVRQHKDDAPTWQESMFYLHFLSMPMFWFVRKDLLAQIRAIHSGGVISVPLGIPASFRLHPTVTFRQTSLPVSIAVPVAYIPLFLNTLTQLLCVSGVHKLTSRVSSLSVTLVLVIRKAVSLIVSVLLLKGGGGGNGMMWLGAVMVLVGTVGYSTSARPKGPKDKADGSRKVEVVEKRVKNE